MNSFEARMKAVPVSNNPIDSERPEPAPEQTTATSSSTDEIVLPPPAPKKQSVSLYLSRSTQQRLKQVAKKRGISISVVAEACIMKSLSTLED